MATDTARTQKRHVREKATIDHLARELYQPKRPNQQGMVRSPTTLTGLLVEEQVRKEWNPHKMGGLPTF